VHAKQDSVDSVAVRFPAVTGRDISVRIASIDPVTTASAYTKPNVLTPVAIAELGIPGLNLPAQPAQLPGTCRSDLLEIDGKPVPVRITGSSSDAVHLQPLTISLCDPTDPSAQPTLQLGPGRHELDSTSGELTALQLDRLVLASAPGGGAGTAAAGRVTGLGATPAAPKLTITHDGRTKLQVRVTDATAPFWLVLGESQNAGWKATVQGAGSLGGSTLVDGFANGWKIDPGAKQSLVVDLEWVPQRRVWDAIVLSVFGGLLCCGLVAAGFWRARRRVAVVADADATPDAVPDAVPVFAAPWRPAGALPAVRTQVLATIAGALLAATIAGVWAGVLVAAGLVAAFRVPRARAFLTLTPAVIVALIGLYVGEKQLRTPVPPVFEWPTLFSRATTPAWAAIVLFGADALYEMVRRSGAAANGATSTRRPVRRIRMRPKK
jgi:hypothetical protein